MGIFPPDLLLPPLLPLAAVLRLFACFAVAPRLDSSGSGLSQGALESLFVQWWAARAEGLLPARVTLDGTRSGLPRHTFRRGIGSFGSGARTVRMTNRRGGEAPRHPRRAARPHVVAWRRHFVSGASARQAADRDQYVARASAQILAHVMRT